MPRSTCGPAASEAGAPISSVTALGQVAEALLVLGQDRRSTSRRSSRLVCDQVANALRAALTALSTSAAEPSAILPDTCSVAGLTTSSVFGSTGSTHWPSM